MVHFVKCNMKLKLNCDKVSFELVNIEFQAQFRILHRTNKIKFIVTQFTKTRTVAARIKNKMFFVDTYRKFKFAIVTADDWVEIRQIEMQIFF